MADQPVDETQEVIIRDGTTSNNELKVNADGSINVNSNAPTTARNIINLQYDGTIATLKATTWETLIAYTIPSNSWLSFISCLAVNNSTACQSRVIAHKCLASYNVATNAYASLFTATAPKFYSRLEVDVLTTSTGGAWTMTVTYTNQNGVTGRTATLAVTNTHAATQHYPLTLQAGDYGVQDVTNITRSTTGRTGTFNLCGIDEVSYYDTEFAWRLNEKVYGKDAMLFSSDQYNLLELQHYADNTTAFYKRLIASFTIFPV